MKQIPLTQGKVAIVDDEDFAFLSQWKWMYSAGGYAIRNSSQSSGKKRLYMHRIIMNTPPGIDVDHINRNKIDNRRSNLRNCTRSQNKFNSKTPVTNTSGYKGVSLYKPTGRWRARIKLNGVQTTIGYFDDPRQAALAYNQAAKEKFGEFARLNEI